MEPSIELTPIEEFQAFRPERAISSRKKIIELSQRIKACPQVQAELIANPYSSKAKETLKEKFGIERDADSIKAIVLSEPKKDYEATFRRLSKKERVEVLFQQIDRSAEITMRLSDFAQAHKDEFWTMSPEAIYTRLSEVAFQTTNPEEVNQRFAQSQRRGFRLAMVNFIQDLEKMKPYRNEFKAQPKATAEKILGTKLNEEITVESLPIGFLLYLKETDFSRTVENFIAFDYLTIIHPATNLAFTILSPRLPEDLQGRISVLNSSLSSEEVQKAKEHELRHLLYDRFSQTENRQEWAKLDFPKRLEEIKALKDHRHFAESFKKLMLAILKDEVVAYLYHGAAQIAIQQASGLVWEEVMSRVRNDLLKRKDFSVEEKASIYQIYQSQHADYLRQLGEYQWLVIKLFRLIKEEKEGMTVEKIIALLTNTPLEKSRHLARYFGIKKPGEVPQKYAEARQKLAEGFSEKVKEVIELLDSAEGQKMSEDEKRTAWEKTVELARMARLPVNLSEEALPALLQVIQRSNHEDFVSLSLDTLSLILDLYNFQPTKVSLEEITRVLEQFGQSKTSKENILLNLKTQFLLAKIDISQEISRDFRQPKKQPTRFNLTKLIEAIREEVRRKMAEQREEQVVPKPEERVYDLTALQARMRDKREYISYQEMYEPLNEIFRGLTTLGRPKEKTLHRCTLSPKIIALLQLIRLEESSLPRAEKLKIVRKQLAHHEEQARTDFHRFRDMGRGRATNEAWEETGVWYEAGSLLKRGHLTPAIYALLDKAQRGFADEVFLSHTDDIPLAILRARERFLGMTPLSDESTSQMLSEIGLEREVFPDLKCAALCAQAIGS